MKTFLLVCIIGLGLSLATNISKAQNIFAIVDGDTVTLWETFALRNCGAVYDMQINQQDYYIRWYQVDVGEVALCLCVFDLSVTYGPLEPGDYTVDVYYTYPDYPYPQFEGSTSFTIENIRETEEGGVISEYQSDCYSGVGLIEGEDEELDALTIYPVPAMTGQMVHLETTSIFKDAVLEIYSISGQKIFSKDYIGKGIITDQWPVEELFPGPGIYIVRLRDSYGIISKLIPVR